MIEWIVLNKEWLFSGIGIVIISMIGRFILRYLFKPSVPNAVPEEIDTYGILSDDKNLIEKVSLDDIKKYDPKVGELHRKVEEERKAQSFIGDRTDVNYKITPLPRILAYVIIIIFLVIISILTYRKFS